MKKIISSIVALVFSSFVVQAQSDTMYVIKAGIVVNKYNVNTEVDSVIFYKPTKATSTVTDKDGNVYPIVTIGTQTWMAENLRTTKYNDGTAITLVTDNSIWWNNYDNTSKIPMMCWYGNDKTTYAANKYGALYNWYVVNTGKLCPASWHVPSDAEWNTLATYLGGESVSGGKLKATTNWTSPNTGATNSTGFTALPAGTRYLSGAFSNVGLTGFWWSVTFGSTNYAWGRAIDNTGANIYKVNNNQEVGLSVRCIKD